MFTRREFMVGTGAVLTARRVQSASAATSLDLATVWPDGNFHTTNAKRFAEEVGKVTGGEIKINVHAGGSLGFKGPEQLRAVRDGLVPLADILNIQQIGDEPMLGTEFDPVPGRLRQELKILHKYLRPEYEAIAAKNNQKVLYMVPWPTQYLHLKVKADTLDGLKGVKIRVPDKNAQDMCAAVGMAPVLIPWGETIPALASGAVAGVSTSSVSGVDGKFWEFLKYVYPTNHTWSCQMVNVNNDTWKKLTPAQQKAIEDLGKKLEPDFWAASLKADTDSLKRLTDGGMEVVQIPPAMMKDFQAKTAPLLDAFLKRVPAEKPVKAFWRGEARRESSGATEPCRRDEATLAASAVLSCSLSPWTTPCIHKWVRRFAPKPLNAAAPGRCGCCLTASNGLRASMAGSARPVSITLTLLMLAEITVRALSNFISWVPADIPVAWEYSSYLMAACFTFGAAMTLRAGGHIRVTLVLGRLQPPARRLLEIAASLVATVFVGFLAIAMARFAWTAFRAGQTSISSGTLLWIPESVIAFGMVLLALQFLARFIQALLGLPLEDHRIKAAPVE